ncbi:hypothetical protein ABH930_000290 [Kitasatospora sp. GAS204A]|uniref:DUF6354 family protein n=1 Tax=unclassified Kitasatospora TaxID=2633591 RepID=UPI0024736322|nr:DUF6354 family protein [Kitasatospora sp. GAS204B]MDH6116871.1 hypothetical protein [Kitasatospora sp. GAS204B]
MSTVRPGQIWQDNDPRTHGRQLRIETVDTTHATAVPVAVTPQGAVALLPGRATRIRVDRFRPTSTGYRLIQDVDGKSDPS